MNEIKKYRERRGLLAWVLSLSKLVKAIALLIIAVVIAMLYMNFTKENKPVITAEFRSSLQKIVETNKLGSLEYAYDAVKTIKDEEEKDIYHIKYNGIVTMGIDFDKLIIEENEESKIITVTIPEPEIQDIYVDQSSIDYIFIDNKYNIETIGQAAGIEAQSDLENRAKKDTDLMKVAKDNAISTVESLFIPLIDSADGYQLVVK